MSEETPESPAFGDVSAAVEPVDLAEKFAREALQRSIAQSGNNAVFPMDEAPDPLSSDTRARFVTACRSLKAAEDALVAARQAYAEAVKALSEEAVR